METIIQQKKFGALTSSEDMNKLADTVKGSIALMSSLIIFVAALKGITVTEQGVKAFAQQAGTTIGAFGAAASAIWTMYGIVKKVVLRVFVK